MMLYHSTYRHLLMITMINIECVLQHQVRKELFELLRNSKHLIWNEMYQLYLFTQLLASNMVKLKTHHLDRKTKFQVLLRLNLFTQVKFTQQLRVNF